MYQTTTWTLWVQGDPPSLEAGYDDVQDPLKPLGRDALEGGAGELLAVVEPH